MLTRKLIALLIITSFSGIVIIDRIQSDPQAITTTNSSDILTQQLKYTGIVAEVDNIAKQITVRIAKSKSDSHGSGVILARQGRTYYVATAGHVVDKDEKYQIVTPDGKTYRLDKQNIIRSDAYDLAIFSFESNRDYTVATLGNYAVANNHHQVVFVSGFANLAEKKNSQRIITGGKVFQSNNVAGLLYRNISYQGMSGGAILDREGRLVGINIGADEQLSINDDGYENLAVGFSSGIPIYEDIFGFLTTQTWLKTEWLNIDNTPATEISDSEWNSITSQLLNLNPPDDSADSVAWMNHGDRLWRYEKYREAIKALEKAIAIDPDFDRAYYTMGLIYWERYQTKGAIEALETAIEINPNISSYWYLLGSSYGRLKDYELGGIPAHGNHYDREISAYEQAIAVNPQNFVLYAEQGLALRDVRRYEEAITAISEAIEINPNLPILYNDRAITYTISQQYENALADYNKAISLNPLFARAYNNRGSTYDYLQQYDKALADYNQAIAIDPDYASPYKNRGNTYYSLGQYHKALADFDKAIAFDPEFIDAYYSRSQLNTVLGKCEQVEADLQRLEQINSRANIVNNCGKDHYSEKYDSVVEAIIDLGSIQPDPQFAKSYKYRGDAYLELAQYDKALADYAQAISLNPNYVEAYRSRANFYLDTGKVDLALADYSQIIAIDPQDISAYMIRGRIYSVGSSKDIAMALADFNKVISLSPESADAYEYRGYLYKELEKVAEAKKDLEKAASLYQQQGNMEQYQAIQHSLQEL